jgi:hypothetical protein
LSFFVFLAGPEKQRGPGIIAVVDVGVLVARLEIGEGAAPEDPAGGRNGVALVQGPGLLLAERVGERIAPLVVGQADGAMPFRWVL